ncbi:MAG: nuclear transport factor 2 family protein [Alphaproteobacteria bacterium]|nr:nuclear transport factor 2 family protein [Alphaproteobacteria bacterium]MDE2340253.1 nuclear transport factor 2 family protein [Alphaproteobacteria bacterium]
MNRDDYNRYLAAFNAKHYDGVADFYAEPIRMDFFGVAIRSRDDLKRFYSFLHSYVNESVTVRNFASSDTLTAVDAIVRIEAVRDLSAETLAAHGCAQFHPMTAGQIFELRQFIFYTIRDGKIEQVECAMLPPEESVVQVTAK